MQCHNSTQQHLSCKILIQPGLHQKRTRAMQYLILSSSSIYRMLQLIHTTKAFCWQMWWEIVCYNQCCGKGQGCRDFWKPSKPYHVGIHWKALAEHSQMSTHVPRFQSFFNFFASYCIGQISHQQHKGSCIKYLAIKCIDCQISLMRCTLRVWITQIYTMFDILKTSTLC